MVRIQWDNVYKALSKGPGINTPHMLAKHVNKKCSIFVKKNVVDNPEIT